VWIVPLGHGREVRDLLDDGVKGEQGLQYPELLENPYGYYRVHATGAKLPDDFAVNPLQYVEDLPDIPAGASQGTLGRRPDLHPD
jgi:hypothetical protein